MRFFLHTITISHTCGAIKAARKYSHLLTKRLTLWKLECKNCERKHTGFSTLFDKSHVGRKTPLIEKNNNEIWTDDSFPEFF